MRPRGRTGNQPFRQPFRQAYETFKPRSEWKNENDATLLLVHLPGMSPNFSPINLVLIQVFSSYLVFQMFITS